MSGPRSVVMSGWHRHARATAHTQHSLKTLARQQRVLTMTTRIAAAVGGFFSVSALFIGHGGLCIGIVSVVGSALLLANPMLYRFGELVAPLAFVVTGYTLIVVLILHVGTDSGMQFYFLVAASIIVLLLGVDHLALASITSGLGAGLAIAVQFLVPGRTDSQPDWAYTFGFLVTVISAWGMVISIIWYAVREVTRAEMAIEAEYERSESLLANILPAKIAQRLKDPAHAVIADKYDDASVLFADIEGFTRRAGDTTPTELVAFLDRLYTRFDALIDRHGLEKIKTTGDSYMVVAGVPEPRLDHLEALAFLALDMADAVADLTDARGRAVPLRIGLAAGPVVAGVVGARKFFYDVWGDAVNVAARMETTGVEGRIQVPQDVYERLVDEFVFEERGEVEVKGKGLMRTWYLVGRRTGE